METTKTDVERFIEKYQIRLRVERVNENPNMDDDFEGDHWRVVLHRGRTGNHYAFHYSKGYGHKGAEPEIVEVLECLHSDLSADGLSFEEFCGEYGYDEDSRKAERTWKAVQEQCKNLRLLVLFGGAWEEFTELEF